MYFVVFESTVPKSRSATSTAYYSNLQKLLPLQPGFISEVPFGSSSNEEQQILISKFVDETSVHKWRLQHDHLMVEKKAREMVFEDYRLRAGPKLFSNDEEEEQDGGASTHKQGHFVVLYERPFTENAAPFFPEITALVDVTKSDISTVTASIVDFAVYQGAQTTLWISGWPTKAAAVQFERSVHRVPGDDVHLIRVARDYGKNDRAEAPEGADEAQAAAALEDGGAIITTNVL